MHAADAARRENLDAGERGNEHRRRHRRPRHAAARGDGRKIAPRGLDDAPAQTREALERAQADLIAQLKRDTVWPNYEDIAKEALVGSH